MTLYFLRGSSGRGGGCTRCGQCLEAKSGENAGEANIPWIRNYERTRAVVKSPKAGCFSFWVTLMGLPRDWISIMLLLRQEVRTINFGPVWQA